MKVRSLLPRRWFPVPRPAALTPRPATTTSRAWGLEALEPRVLLSADPVLGAVHLALAPQDQAFHAADDAYHANARLLTADAAAMPTMHALAVQNPQIVGPDVLTGSVGPNSGNNYANTNSIHINGTTDITVSGTISLGSNNTNFLAGNSSATTDALTLSAGGNIAIHGFVSTGNQGGDQLSSLTITAAQNVTFDQTVEINGTLDITATGVVTFSHGISLGSGGTLRINGATQLVLNDSITLTQGGAGSPGNIELSADEINLQMSSEQIHGTGAVTLRPATLGTPMAIFSPAGAATLNTLNLENSELAAFADGFSGFTFGYVTGGHAVSGAGAVQVGASAAVDSIVMHDSVRIYGGSITVTDYSDRNAILRLASGDSLTLDAYGDITLVNAIEADHLTLASATGKIQQTDSNVDTLSSEPLRGLDLTATAVTGVTLGSLEVNQLDVANSGQGAITLNENAARSTSRFADTDITGAVSVLHLTQSGVTGTNGISLTTHAREATQSVTAMPGTITVAAGAGNGITLATDGALSLNALGTGSDIHLLAPISVHGGAVTLSAVDAFDASAAGTITASGAAAITLSSGTGSLALAGAISTVGGSLTLNSGAGLDLTGITLDAGPGGAIALTSVGDLKVGIISAAASISLTASNGAILDALAVSGTNLRGDAALTTLTAANGIGTAAEPLLTSVGSLTATVTGSAGGIFVTESNALTIAAGGLTTAGSGAIVVRNSAADMTVAGPVMANGSGHILLEAIAGALAVQASVAAQAGSISLVAGSALSVTGTEVRARGANQTLDLRAGTSFTMGGSTSLITANGAQRLQAGTTLALGAVDAGTGTVTVVAGGAVTSAAQSATVAAGNLRVQAGGGVGTGGAPLQLKVATLAASGGDAMVFNEFDSLSVGSVAEVAVNRVSSAGTAAATTPAAALAGLTTSNASIVLNAGAAVSLDSAVAATSIAGSHLRVSAGTTLAVNAAVASTGGLVTLMAGGAITHTAAGSVTTAAQGFDEQAGGAITMAAGTAITTSGGRLRVQAGGALALGQLNAGNAEAWLQGSRLISATGSGVDLTASDARLIATGTTSTDGIGSGADALSLQVQRLAVQSAGAGGVFITEADALIVDTIAASTFTRVQADGTLAALPTDAQLAGITSAAGLVVTTGGNLITGATVTAQRVRLSAGNDLFVGLLSGGLTSTGAVTLTAVRDLQVQDNLSATGGLDLSAGRDLLMNAGTSATAQGASAFAATRDIRVATVDVGTTKALTVNAGGSITDADTAGDSTVNLKAGKLVLIAASSIGQSGNAIETTATYLGASAGGGLFVDETDALGVPGALSTSFGTVQRVAADGSVSTLATTDVQGLSAGASPLVLRLLGGALTVDAAVQTQGGAVRLDASGAVTLNAAVASNGGALSLIAGGAVTQAAAGSLTTAGGALDAQATGAWTMAQGARLASAGGTLRLAATGALALAQLDAGSGAMSVTASQVKDLAGDAASDADLIAGSLLLRTTGTAATDGVGSSTDALEIAVQRLAVDAAGGGVFLAQTGDVVIDSFTGFSGARVQVDGTVAAGGATDAALTGVRSSGSLVLRGSGSVAVNGASSAGGTMLLTSATDLTIGAALTSAGALSLNAGNDLLLNANVSGTGSTRSADLLAVRDITQAQGASLQTANGVIALQAGRDITVETINAGTAGAALIAGGAIVDGDAAGDVETDITAAALRLTAGGAIGSGANALDTAVSTLSASAASLSLVQAQALTVDRTITTLQRVAADGSTAALDLGAQEDLRTSTGALLLTVATGDLTLNPGTASTDTVVSSAGTLLLRTVAGSLTVKAGITAAGATSLRAGGDLSFTAAGDVTLAGASSLDAEAGSSLTMADGTVFSSGTGSLRLSAVVNMGIGALQTAGDVSLLARTITDVGGSETDVTAASLRVVTTGTGTTHGFGTGAAPLQLQVATLAANIAGTGAGGFFAREADALNVDTVSVSVSRIGADGTTTALADAALSDLVSGGNVVLTTGGTLSLLDGVNADGLALQSGGNVLLDVGADLGVAGAIRSTAGAISLQSALSMTLLANVTITRTGRTMDLQAGGALTMAAATSLATVDSAIRMQAGGDLTLGSVTAGLANVSLISTGGSIVAAAGHTGPEVSAAALRANAAVGVGTSSDRLDTAVQRISARAAGGGIWLQEADAITITDVAVSVRRVSTLATTTATVDDAMQSDLVTTGGNGSIALATTNGSINFADGTAPAHARSTSADGTGTVSLKAGGVAAVVNAPAGAITQQGPVTIDSGVKFDGGITITAGQGGGRGDGPVTISGPIDGTAGGAADVLVVNSDGADVVFGGAIGGTQRLDGLTVSDARDVRFDQDVKLAGALTLQASGTVEFKGGLDLSSGSLSIVGASRLIIGNVVISSGDAVIHVDALTLSGLISAANPAATLELAGAGASSGVNVGNGGGTGLALSAAQLAAMQGFGQVQIGRNDQGTTSIETAVLASVVTPHLVVAGGNVALQGAAGAAVNAGVQLLDLTAAHDLTLAGALAVVASGADVHATVGGALRMATDGVLTTSAGDVQLAAGGDLQVGRIDTRATGGQAASVALVSTGGTISEANADAAADVFADLLTLRGHGPAITGGLSEVPAALDVQATTLDVDAPSGTVLRDSGTNGRTAFNLIDGGQLYQLLVAIGAPSRQVSTTAAPTSVSPTSTVDAWAWLNAVRPLQESRTTPLFTAETPSLAPQGLLLRDAVEIGFAEDAAPLLASRLALDLSVEAPPADASLADPTRFRVWSEELSL